MKKLMKKDTGEENENQEEGKTNLWWIEREMNLREQIELSRIRTIEDIKSLGVEDMMIKMIDRAN